MDWMQAHNAAKQREEAARKEAQAVQERAEREQSVQQRTLLQLVDAAQHGQVLESFRGVKVTARAKALYGVLSRDWDSSATDQDLAERVGCTESQAIAALAELVHTKLAVVRDQGGKRRIMIDPL